MGRRRASCYSPKIWILRNFEVLKIALQRTAEKNASNTNIR
jgi:hypothetical protein